MLRHGPMPADHTVEQPGFDDDVFVAERVARFLMESLSTGGAAMVVAKSGHLAELAAVLRDVDRDALVLLDAEATLAAITRDGSLDEALFMHVMGEVIRPLRERGKIHAYGEIVDLLLEGGRTHEVAHVESLWSALLASMPFGAFHLYRLHVPRSVLRLEQRTRVLEVEVERRQKLETRMLGLLDYTGKLTSAHSRAEIATLTIEVGLRSVEASAAALWLVSADGKFLELAAATPGVVNPEVKRIPLDEDGVVAHAVHEHRAIFLSSLAQYEREFPLSFQGRGRGDPAQVAFAILPVAGDGKPLGGLWLAYDRERAFDAAERTFKEIVARHCGLALERTDLAEKEQRARAEIELLYALTSDVAVADDLEAVYDIALNTVMFGTASDRAAILLIDDGKMRFKAWRGLSDAYRAAIDGHSPWVLDDKHPVPIGVEDTEIDPEWASFREVFHAEGIRSLAFIPLLHRRRLVGKFMVYRDQPQPYTARELQLASTVAFHVGESLARKHDEAALARAFVEEKQARAEAEEATRAREEILSVVSHDLRNPLGTVLIGASSLLQVDGDRRVAGIAGRIHRQAERMARLIDDLVDFAGIQAGKLAIDRVEHAPTEIIHAATDLFGPLAEERGLTLEKTVQPNLPSISCDSERALQVLANLMSNALKVTPKGGRVQIGVEARAADVVFFVNDSGPGIDATELPHMFERYWRGKASQYRGAGLGLSIARGIVDAHGGKIWAESTIGVGSTFYFSLAPSN